MDCQFLLTLFFPVYLDREVSLVSFVWLGKVYYFLDRNLLFVILALVHPEAYSSAYIYHYLF